MYFIGIGTAVPSTRYTQAQCYEALQNSPQYGTLDRRARALLQRVLLGDNGIDTRALALDPLEEAFDARLDILHRRFAQHAPRLAQEAAEEALGDAGLTPRDIDGLIVSTCTGYLCPGLTSYVIERLGLEPSIFALDLVGQGSRTAPATTPKTSGGWPTSTPGRTRFGKAPPTGACKLRRCAKTGRRSASRPSAACATS